VNGYDPTTALVVVDVQNDFADPAGSLWVVGGDEVVARINEQIELATSEDAVVVYTQDWHPPTTPHFAKDGGIWPVHCVAGTWGAELHPELLVAGPSVHKGSNGEDGYSGFTMRDPETGEDEATELEPFLRERGVTTVVVAGLATDYCVLGTVLDARRLGFETVVLSQAVAAVEVTPGDGERALAQMAGAGARVV
jgi:nicotinamidase/pyrazinamidase